jgi:putative NADPH-quinone reductase
MGKRILIINGHPDPRPERLCAGLAEAYAKGALEAGHEVRRIDVGALDFPLIRDAAAFIEVEPPPVIARVQEDVRWADHLFLVHPLWLGSAPALLKGFFEQVFRYGFAIQPGGKGMSGLLRPRSVRTVVTMGMPAFAYSLIFGAFGVRGFERGVLQLSGMNPVRHTFLGHVDGTSGRRARWLEQMHRLGRSGR